MKFVEEGGKFTFTAILRLRHLENNGYYIVHPSERMATKLEKLKGQVQKHEGSIANREKSLEKTVGSFVATCDGSA